MPEKHIAYASTVQEDDDEAELFDQQEEKEAYPCLNAIYKALDAAICKVGGSAIIKYNGKCPKDAAWISSEKSLKCTSAFDALLLLKASDRLCFSSKPRSLQLTEWHDGWRGEQEFRLFVYKGQITAITQRDCSAFYRHLSLERQEIVECLKKAYAQEVFTAAMYIDVYCCWKKEIMHELQREALEECTDFYLLNEKDIAGSQETVFRCIESDADCRLALFTQNMYPVTDLEVHKFFA